MIEYYSIVRGEFDDRNRGFQWVNRTVEGEIVNTVFGIRKEEKGWRITHLPTGFLLVDVYFETLEGAKTYARITKNLYGNLLDNESITLFKDTRGDNEEFAQYYKVKNKLDNYTGTFSMKDFSELGVGL